jgi:ribose transport system ATP-binding protein
LKKGEILGLFGLMGSGRTELARAIFGVDEFDTGEIYINGKKEEINSPAAAVKNGLGFLTEDRLNSGLAMSMSVGHNVTLPSLDDFTKMHFLLDLKKERKHIDILINDLKIRTPNQSQQVQFLSGGNQQKVVFAKWIMAQSKILILDDPTQGIDVEAKEEVHKFIYEFTRKLQRSIILISSELEEIISLCDRVLVIHEGSIITEIPAKDLDQELIMNYAVGGKSHTRSNHVA